MIIISNYINGRRAILITQIVLTVKFYLKVTFSFTTVLLFSSSSSDEVPCVTCVLVYCVLVHCAHKYVVKKEMHCDYQNKD